jgi:ketosteroid isomerase-like protein
VGILADPVAGGVKRGFGTRHSVSWDGKSVEYRSAEVFHVNDGSATEAWFLNDNPDPDFWS